MSLSAIERLVHTEPYASLAAVLVVTRGIAPGRKYPRVRLDDPEAVAVFLDADTAWAIAGRADVRAKIETNDGRRLDMAELKAHAMHLTA